MPCWNVSSGEHAALCFQEDLSQYSTIIDVAKVPAHARKKAERLAREIEVRHSIRGRSKQAYSS